MQRKKERIKYILLRAAEKEFSAVEYDGTSVWNIAARSGGK